MATYDLATATPSSLSKGDILNCSYSGSKKSIVLPPGTYKLEVWGAQGGYRSNATYGGKGGYSYGTLTLNNTTNLYVYVGKQAQPNISQLMRMVKVVVIKQHTIEVAWGMQLEK